MNVLVVVKTTVRAIGVNKGVKDMNNQWTFLTEWQRNVIKEAVERYQGVHQPSLNELIKLLDTCKEIKIR